MTYSLLWKLVGISALVVGAAIATVWIAIDYLAADYFMVLMKNYGIDPTDSHGMFAIIICLICIDLYRIFTFPLSALYTRLLCFLIPGISSMRATGGGHAACAKTV